MTPQSRPAIFLIASGALLLARPTFAQEQPTCAPLEITPLTYDVNDPRTLDKVKAIEGNHFSIEVESLQKGLTGILPLDIAFVLRYVPNHYRALASMANWQLQHGLPAQLQNQVMTADCYFQRALSFKPGDGNIYLAFAVYLHRVKRYDDAGRVYEMAERALQESAADEHVEAHGADLYYNRGLLELDRGNIAKAEEYAAKAYAQGYPLPGLKNRLARAKAAKK